MGDIRIGISGWRYPPWRGVFYPDDLPQRRELEFASRALQSIELNGSFYSLQRPQHYALWHQQTPGDFIFSVKAPRYITHIRRLKQIEQPLKNFMASGLLGLREKLGPILWQFPPSFEYEPATLEDFLRLLPHDTLEAARIAGGHDEFMNGRTWFDIDAERRLRHAIEIRHESFVDPSFVALLRRYEIALVIADTAGKWPYREDVTSDFVYLRLHGDKVLYASGYTDSALDRWAARIDAWRKGSEPDDARRISEVSASRCKGRDVYCYFDNDVKVRAPFDAQSLIAKVTAQDARVSVSVS